jgi:hypothetical protein
MRIKAREGVSILLRRTFAPAGTAVAAMRTERGGDAVIGRADRARASRSGAGASEQKLHKEDYDGKDARRDL